MSGNGYSLGELIRNLKEADVLLGQGKTVAEVIRQLSVNKITYYRWRREYGGLKVEQAKRLTDLEKENAPLKKLVTDLSSPMKQSHGFWTVPECR